MTGPTKTGPTMTGATEPARPATLSVRGLTVSSHRGTLVHELDLEIAAGERVGLIGESGSGKSMTALAVMGLLPDGIRAQGSVRLGGAQENLLAADERTLSRLRGREVAMVFQEPMTALNPLMTVGKQVAEIITQHGANSRQGSAASRAVARQRAVELLDRVRLPDPARAAAAFPHQLSGGQRQRVMIAMAMANRPRLLLADEPTTALDVTVQAGVLALVDDLVRTEGTSLLFITHDLAVVASVCERVLVMNAGRIVEQGPVAEVLSRPQHPYTQSLLAASSLGRRGAPAPPGRAVAAGHTSLAAEPDGPTPVFNEVVGDAAVRVRDVTRDYRRVGASLLRRSHVVHGLRGVSFDVAAGQRFGIVGESGSGKSTLLRLLCALDEPSAGTITVAGQSIGVDERRLRQFRRDVQIVFQDPMGSLDPRMRVGDIVAEPLREGTGDERRRRVRDVLTSVGLPADAADRHPHQFSGGQRQRISIARALVTRPKVLVADEPVSALDVSVRATVLDLLDELVDTHDLTLVLVSHDLSVVRHVCDTVAVVCDGRIVECGPTESVYEQPQHAYTRALVAASPSLSASLDGVAP